MIAPVVTQVHSSTVPRILQISDLHVRGRPRARTNQRLKHIVDQLIKLYPNGPKPVVAVTGDLTQNGRKAEYTRVVNIFRPLRAAGFEMFICPGNHDVAEFGSAFRPAARLNFQLEILGNLLELAGAQRDVMVMDQMYPMVRRFDNARLIGLDTANREDFLATGRIGNLQLQRLDGLLGEDRPAGERTVLCLHHHPFYRDVGHRLIDADELQEVIRGRCDAMMFGHRHRSERWRDKLDIPIVFAAGQTTVPVTRRLDRKKQKYYEVRWIEIRDDGSMLASLDQLPV